MQLTPVLKSALHQENKVTVGNSKGYFIGFTCILTGKQKDQIPVLERYTPFTANLI